MPEKATGGGNSGISGMVGTIKIETLKRCSHVKVRIGVAIYARNRQQAQQSESAL